jgi:hypothetical protein
VSHESALELLGLSDIIPNAIHLSVPRTRRKLSRRSGVALHTTTRPLAGPDIVVRDGMRLTGPARTLADVAEAGLAPEQVVRAARQAIGRGMTTHAESPPGGGPGSGPPGRAARRDRPCREGHVRYASAAAFRRALETRFLALSRDGSVSLVHADRHPPGWGVNACLRDPERTGPPERDSRSGEVPAPVRRSGGWDP